MLVFNPAFYFSSGILSKDPPRMPQVQQTAEQNRPLRGCRRFNILAFLHAQGPNTGQRFARQKYRSTPSGTVVPRNTLFWQLEALSEPPDYQSKC
jgi:hypothetical protein